MFRRVFFLFSSIVFYSLFSVASSFVFLSLVSFELFIFVFLFFLSFLLLLFFSLISVASFVFIWRVLNFLFASFFFLSLFRCFFFLSLFCCSFCIYLASFELFILVFLFSLSLLLLLLFSLSLWRVLKTLNGKEEEGEWVRERSDEGDLGDKGVRASAPRHECHGHSSGVLASCPSCSESPGVRESIHRVPECRKVVSFVHVKYGEAIYDSRATWAPQSGDAVMYRRPQGRGDGGGRRR